MGSLSTCWVKCERIRATVGTGSSQKLKIEPDGPATWYLPKENKMHNVGYVHLYVAALLTTAKCEMKATKCSSLMNE